MALTDALAPLRAHTGQRLTHGLDDATVERLAKGHPDLAAVIEAAAALTGGLAFEVTASAGLSIERL